MSVYGILIHCNRSHIDITFFAGTNVAGHHSSTKSIEGEFSEPNFALNATATRSAVRGGATDTPKSPLRTQTSL